MKTLEIRRHSLRTQPDQHLSQEGVILARRVGQAMGPFGRVVTSALPRAFETAIAMGFAVDEQEEFINSYHESVGKEAPWPQTFAGYAAAIRKRGAAAAYAGELAAFYHRLVESLPESDAALVINHGGIVEMSAIGCLPDADYGSFGPHCEYCDGVRLFWEQGRFVRLEILRV
jgi:broad specificity phosphatase PhoE